MRKMLTLGFVALLLGACGQSNQQKILGKWQIDGETVYVTDGSMITLNGPEMCYQLEGDTIKTAFANQATIPSSLRQQFKSTLKFDGDTMTMIPEATDSTNVYTRIGDISDQDKLLLVEKKLREPGTPSCSDVMNSFK
ncbi:MAG: hypothetical protein LCH85_08320 [Chloroflexi bacterium]|nr:hypothetical protein [Chloroflexota bacterium]